ncbi:MAG: T9SS type A sorting domain-containing protein, partial [Bacteroidales bacterium]|nr:T9SS type A sorting domain-containing protein [Bacteroidales bacterium]
AMAVCGNNQVLADTPEGSDTIFMRFDGNSSTRIAIVGATKPWDYEQIHPSVLLDVTLEIETERGISIIEKSYEGHWGQYDLMDYGLSGAKLGCFIDIDSLSMGMEFTTIKIYGYNSGETGHIPCKIVSLVVTGNLTSLDALGCPNLERLICDNCQLTSLNISGCSALRVLVCHNGSEYDGIDEDAVWGNNRLTSLDVSGCLNLRWLQCHYNQLSSLDVGNCPYLEFLRCTGNRLTSLELGAYHKLEFLDCVDNQLDSLDLYDISNMDRCRLFGNRLSKVFYTGEKGKMREIAFGNNGLPLNKCLELSKFWSRDEHGFLQGNSQHIPVSLGVNEHYDLHADMELDGVRTTLRVTRKGGGYLDPKLYSVENDWLSFSEKGEYTVEMTNPKVREHIAGNNYGWPHSAALVTVYLDVRVGMPDDDPNNPNNPTTANEALGALPAAALQVYPNPATDALHVELLSSAASESLRAVRILSQSGHLCHTFGSGFDNIPVADLPAGLYFIEAETTAGTVLRQKFVKR